MSRLLDINLTHTHTLQNPHHLVYLPSTWEPGTEAKFGDENLVIALNDLLGFMAGASTKDYTQVWELAQMSYSQSYSQSHAEQFKNKFSQDQWEWMRKVLIAHLEQQEMTAEDYVDKVLGETVDKIAKAMDDMMFYGEGNAPKAAGGHKTYLFGEDAMFGGHSIDIEAWMKPPLMVVDSIDTGVGQDYTVKTITDHAGNKVYVPQIHTPKGPPILSAFNKSKGVFADLGHVSDFKLDFKKLDYKKHEQSIMDDLKKAIDEGGAVSLIPDASEALKMANTSKKKHTLKPLPGGQDLKHGAAQKLAYKMVKAKEKKAKPKKTDQEMDLEYLVGLYKNNKPMTNEQTSMMYFLLQQEVDAKTQAAYTIPHLYKSVLKVIAAGKEKDKK